MTVIDRQYPARAACLDDLIEVLSTRGVADAEAAGPEMTTLDHHLQCADVLRERHPEDIELQLAGLIHDIGHRLQPGRPDLHGVVAADYVRDLLGDRIADLVELHVDAKRYLVAVEPSYRDQLSAGSARTLIAQGEALDPEQAAAFAAHPLAADAVALRRADEAAKVPGRSVAFLDSWLPVLAEAVAAR